MTDLQECIKFANENQICSVATAEGDQPRVRVIRFWFADDTGFYIQTQSGKAFVEQMEQNNKIEMCFYSPEVEKVLRVSGKVEPVNDMALKKRCLEERAFLKDMGIEKAEDPVLAIFRLYTGEAYIWTRDFITRESEIERVKF